ncbi:hypothetical protein [Blastomonas fulva]|uniref:hypothetical protein n=1 Tax=Blastomonas fulva TaxID=1550728 RepID=UPI003F6F8AC8
MSKSLTNQSDQILADAAAVKRRVQMGPSIGSKSRALKREHLWKKIAAIAISIGVILVAAGVVGAIIDGIGFYGVLLTVLAAVVATVVLGSGMKLKVPTPEKLAKEPLKVLAGKTEIWLESQRPALPAPAVNLIDNIGVQLDMLAPQLQTLEENSEPAREIRKLVGEHLPELITGYRKIPANMRKEKRGERTPDEQLLHGLGVIEREIASATRTIAEGDADKLAIRGRFLELKYDGVADSQ